MKKWILIWKGFWRTRDARSGQGLAEYLILLMLIAVVSISATKKLGGVIQRKLTSAEKAINGKVGLRGAANAAGTGARGAASRLGAGLWGAPPADESTGDAE